MIEEKLSKTVSIAEDNEHKPKPSVVPKRFRSITELSEFPIVDPSLNSITIKPNYFQQNYSN